MPTPEATQLAEEVFYMDTPEEVALALDRFAAQRGAEPIANLYVIVPRAPTEAMCATARKLSYDFMPGDAELVWSRMIEAAPALPMPGDRCRIHYGR